MVKTYSLRKDGDIQLSLNFKAKEFKCKGGEDEILISEELIAVLQDIRNHFGKSVNVMSGYRSPAYNRSIHGATNSYHVKGMAADIQIPGVDPITVALYAQSKGVHGIGLYSYGTSASFVHVDVREGKWRGLQISKSGSSASIPSYFPVLRVGSTGNAVVILQRLLGFTGAGTDGKFGKNTEGVVKTFQIENGLENDGVGGPLTWSNLTDLV